LIRSESIGGRRREVDMDRVQKRGNLGKTLSGGPLTRPPVSQNTKRPTSPLGRTPVILSRAMAEKIHAEGALVLRASSSSYLKC